MMDLCMNYACHMHHSITPYYRLFSLNVTSINVRHNNHVTQVTLFSMYYFADKATAAIQHYTNKLTLTMNGTMNITMTSSRVGSVTGDNISCLT